MAKPLPVLQTRFVGFTQHVSRHPLAPADLVYEVEGEEPARERPPLHLKILAIVTVAGCGGVIYDVTSYVIARFF